MSDNNEVMSADVVLVGAGIMSTTLAVFLKELQPHLRIAMIERMPGEAQESSGAWNNAGTGHAANCELNYTPMRKDGSVDIAKALEVNVEFDMSRQFWSYLIRKGAIASPDSFIHPVPHMSFVIGEDRAAFLKKRHAAMSAHHCYHGMEFSQDHKQIAEWAPLIMEGRDPNQVVAATRIVSGADVNYGALTRNLMDYLKKQDRFAVHFSHDVTDLQRRPTGDGWWLDVHDEQDGETRRIGARYVFLGAGGRAISLLAEVGHPRGQGLRRLPGERHLAALRQGRGRRPPQRQGLRHGRGRLAADVGAPSRHPHHRRQALAAVRPLCRLLDQVLEARLAARPAPVDPAGQHPAAAGRRPGQLPARGIPGRPGVPEQGPSLQGAARVLSQR